MAIRTHTYDIDQIMYSFMRYRQDHFFDKESAKNEFEKHFNPALAGKMFNDVWERKEVQTRLKDNRERLERSGKLTPQKFTNKELKEVKQIRTWALVEMKGRKVRATPMKIKIKGKEIIRYRDSYGRFTSNPN